LIVVQALTRNLNGVEACLVSFLGKENIIYTLLQ